MTPRLIVENAGSLATLQDLGRRGHASIGVGISGAVDRASHNRANRLVGNLSTAATVEVTLGGLVARATGRMDIAVTGADVDVDVDGVRHPPDARIRVRTGQRITVPTPRTGLRNYLAVRGGFDAQPILGSRSTDTLARLGPDPLGPGDVLTVGRDWGPYPLIDHIPRPTSHHRDLPVLLYVPGPRDDWFTEGAHAALCRSQWVVSPSSNRVGVRLLGPPLERATQGELPSEGVVTGAIQVPPAGPIVFLDDHPVTGGYPVIGVVERDSLDRLAQARAGELVVFRPLSRSGSEFGRPVERPSTRSGRAAER
ncbi:biotin-dependent carboxyltransferase family protein [Nocardioides sp. NPDC092400]|uniref:5-oxoprolinase subunit C family protein n=1 Tax=Nocardioides sp. NPDC092400 TaxID=3155196 RepID=UPI0034393B50